MPPNLIEGIRSAIPTPIRVWTTDPNDLIIYEALDGELPEFNPGFFEGGFRQFLIPGIPSNTTVLDFFGINGGLIFNTSITTGLTNPAILPELERRDAEFIGELVFDEILGSYTCIVENEYGADAATTVVTDCASKFYVSCWLKY